MLVRQLKDFLHEKSIRRRILLNLIFLALVPFIITSVFIYTSMYYTVLKDYKNRINQSLDTCTESVNGELMLYIQSSRMIVTSNNVISGLQGYFDSDMDKIAEFRALMKSLTNHLANWGTNVDAFKFCLADYDGFEDAYITKLDNPENDLFINNALSSRINDELWNPIVKYDNRHMKRYISFCRNISDFSNHQGLLEINIPYDRISRHLNDIKSISANDIIMHVNNGGTVLYYRVGANLLSEISSGSIDKNSYFIMNSKTMADKSTIIVAVPKSTISKRYVQIMVYIFIAFLFFIAAIIYVSIRTSKRITKSMDNFINYLKSNDELLLNNELPDVDPDDEIAIIQRKFFSIIIRMNGIYKDLLDTKNQNNLLEMELLQARFNPHLLYNTLSTIKWSVLRNNDKVTSEIIDALTNYYRIALSKGYYIIRISDELNMIREYISVVSYTHRDRYSLTINVEDSLMGKSIIKHTLQPIVENAVLHGLKGKGSGGRISINGVIQGGDILLEVTDNGYGMSQETIDKILGLDYETAYGGYGIKNLIKRIQSYYGEDYGVTIESEIDKGTRVIVRLKIVDTIL